MNQIGVIGAGIMGGDVALDLSCHHFRVVLMDISTTALNKAKDRIIENLRMFTMMRPEFKALVAAEVISRISFTSDYDLFSGVDAIIENVSENWAVKEKVYQELAARYRPEVLYCVNTSCISITKIASLLPGKENVIGMHFMNPVPLKDTVELITGHYTSVSTLERAKEFLKLLGKRPVTVNDSPGFVANRLSHLFMNEAAFLIQDNVAGAKEIDAIFKRGYGHVMGPLETADLIGLDTVVNSLNILYESYQDSKFRCCPLLRKMVDAGLLGRKSGEGFYKYA